MIKDFIDEYLRYKVIGRKAIDQVPDADLNRVVGEDTNSIAVIVRHISGNLESRFTDFLSSDGEKPWRDRDAEFAETKYARAEIDRLWEGGWAVLERELARLSDGDLERRVTIRGQAFTVHEALSRSLAHTAYHVGQIVLLARMLKGNDWKWISIPRGQSDQYNKNPTMEKKPE
jgi:uncharacterized damage-inducible protein DinB